VSLKGRFGTRMTFSVTTVEDESNIIPFRAGEFGEEKIDFSVAYVHDCSPISIFNSTMYRADGLDGIVGVVK